MSAPSCPGCGKPVDPLRAGHVAILGTRFVYYCNLSCKLLHLRGALPDVDTAAPPAVLPPPPALPPPEPPKPTPTHDERPTPSPVSPMPAASPATEVSDEPGDTPPSSESSEPSIRTVPGWRESTVRAPRPLPPRSGVRLRGLSMSKAGKVLATGIYIVGLAAGALGPAMGLLGTGVGKIRLSLALVAAAAALVRFGVSRRDPSEASPLVAIVPLLAAVAAAVWAALVRDRQASDLAGFAGLLALAVLATELLVARALEPTVALRRRLVERLDVRVRLLRGEAPVLLDAHDVRPGEVVSVEAGEVIGVDGVVLEGEATVTPWFEAPVDVIKRKGDLLVAGGRVIAGRLRLSVTWSGVDRTWFRAVTAPEARIDVGAPTARGVRLAVERGTPVVAVLAAVAAYANNTRPLGMVAAACAAALALGPRGLAGLATFIHQRALLAALGSGVVYRDGASFERAATTDVVVFCARGTLLLGEPELVAVEPFGSVDASRVLELAAGAEAGASHPFAAAILRASRARGVRPETMRSALPLAGLGVSALTATGERLVVGSRSLLLLERIGVGVADARVTELEAQGRSVLLVALGDRVTGLLALQDGMRPGARAAVQRVLDAQLEPVLLSGEARETCESLGRALDIEHIRPEIPPMARAAEVRTLTDGGHVVAVVGRAAGDDSALAAGDVAVVLGAAGASPVEWSVSLASDDVRDAASALTLAHRSRRRLRVALIAAVAPGLFALLLRVFGLAPLAMAPLAALLGTAAALVYAKSEG
ncbi:MAG: HAD family hydrolase [Myxococcales bacterium]